MAPDIRTAISRSAVFVAVAILVVSANEGSAETRLRVASWNVANLHHQAEVELRPGIGTKRKESDFEALKRYADGLDADIIALQEIGTEEAAERLFPPSKFEVLMESRYTEDIAGGQPSKDIYTAVAVRRRADISIGAQGDIVDLQIEDIGSDGQVHHTRRGTAVRLDVAGTPLWFVSLHLKSSCATTKAADVSIVRDCVLLWQQRLPLKAFIDKRVSEGTAFILAGDFNRRFRQFAFDGPMWAFLNGGNLDEPLLAAHPETVTRKCPTRRGASTQPIDWFLIDARVAHWFQEGSYWETRFSFDDVKASGGTNSYRLSDHCPIQIDLVLP